MRQPLRLALAAHLLIFAAPGSASADGALISLRLDNPLLLEDYEVEGEVYSLAVGVGFSASTGYALELGEAGLVAIEGGGGYCRSFDSYERGMGFLYVGGRLGVIAGRHFPSLYYHMGWGSSSGEAEGDRLRRKGVLFEAGVSYLLTTSTLGVGLRLGYRGLVPQLGAGSRTTGFVLIAVEANLLL